MCWDCYGYGNEVTKKDFNRGKVEVSDFDDETRYRHTKRRTAKRLKRQGYKTRPGCPENDYKAHIYVWTTERESDNFFSDYYGFPKKQSHVCVGCGKVNKTKASEKYEAIKARKYAAMYGNGENQPRGEPVSRYGRLYRPSYSYWAWEQFDEDYKAARKQYMDRRGIDNYWYNF